MNVHSIYLADPDAFSLFFFSASASFSFSMISTNLSTSSGCSIWMTRHTKIEISTNETFPSVEDSCNLSVSGFKIKIWTGAYKVQSYWYSSNEKSQCMRIKTFLMWFKLIQILLSQCVKSVFSLLPRNWLLGTRNLSNNAPAQFCNRVYVM